ncbi:MAG: hypothetical protein B7Y80_05070 [Hyphomicrobium sp. 32-62-53]|nr:MAG: hypothetical protein B7Z29_05205 [Hyphomicrobium sp. 12-62-95]OYY01301.1 MAG: hypothetical protein B7Y80_05070 [Hyphomicrobium sp. 32-62-53]
MKAENFIVSKRPRLGSIEKFPRIDFADYERQHASLQSSLQAIQQAYLGTRERAVVVLEGWDASGKGGIVRRLGWALDPRSFKVHAAQRSLCAFGLQSKEKARPGFPGPARLPQCCGVLGARVLDEFRIALLAAQVALQQRQFRLEQLSSWLEALVLIVAETRFSTRILKSPPIPRDPARMKLRRARHVLPSTRRALHALSHSRHRE